MRKISMLPPFFFVFLVSLSDLPIATSTARYIAVDDVTLNCGASGNSTAGDKRLWIGDLNSALALIEEPNHKSRASTAGRVVSIDPVPFKTARISSFPFTYEFRVSSGPKFLRLYFLNSWYQGFYDYTDLFTVKAGPFTLLSNFSASLDYSSNTGSISKEFCIPVGEKKTLNVTFIPSPSDSREFYAFVNGIEIVSMPNHLYYTGIDLPYVGQLSRFPFYNDTALQMVFRINVGGGDILPVADTGMFRKWSQDTQNYLGGAIILHNSDLTPRFSKIPNYTAPDDVYKTAESMGTSSTNNLASNLTWQLRVDYGFDYLVRLHFCEINRQVTSVGERIFRIYIDNQIAEARADVLEWSGRNETPVYKDYVVRIQDSDYLYVDLSPIVPARDGIIDVILNGMEVFKLSDSVGNLAALDPFPYSQNPARANESKTKKKKIIAVGSVMGIFVLLTLACGVVLWKLRKTERSVSFYSLFKCCCWPETEKGKSSRTRASSLPGEVCRHFTLEEIKRATQNFKEEFIIGVGGFGKVYKGLVNRGTTTVAIKRLNSESKQGFREFRTEIEMLSRLRHGHLVSLIGYCVAEGEMILIYDFMANGTLRQHLYDTQNVPLSWKQRLQICLGAARGLEYLHTGVEQPIIHRDVKTTNILLDDKWKAKVSDFGLCKTVQEESAVSTVVKGTFGYLDPDYARCGKLTVKSDVYSFGVVLLEVLCGRKALDDRLETEQWNLANWAGECFQRGTIGEIIDPYLRGKIAPECFKVYVEIVESCVRRQSIRRPTMNYVKEKLHYALELQEIADTARERLNSGGQDTYPEVLSFTVAGTSGVARNNNAHSESGLETDSGTGLGTIYSGLTSSSPDSDAVDTDAIISKP